jgi:pseudouridine-5'-phosphate glycosidase
MHEFLNISPEVAHAISERRPVVALESTVIAHGLPRPQNLDTAHRLQEVVRESGAVPATIAIIGGKLTVGLSDDELALLAERADIRKISTRDIPVAVAQGWDGATTVASTTWIAYRGGIKVFATGGIGGVHRGSLPDVSADLPELARRSLLCVPERRSSSICPRLVSGSKHMRLQSPVINAMSCRRFTRARVVCEWMCAQTMPMLLPGSFGRNEVLVLSRRCC